jgi:transcription elongation factor SPT6
MEDKEMLTRRVFLNANAFLKITQPKLDTMYRREEEDKEDVLDSTRVHSEDYMIARKMAADAMEVDEEEIAEHEESDPSRFVKDLMNSQDKRKRLEELSLDDFAEELEKVVSIPKRNTLYMIREELQNPYGEKRLEFKLPSAEETFTMLTGETRKTLSLGYVVPVVVKGHRHDQGLDVRLDSGLEAIVKANYISDVPIKIQDTFHIGQVIKVVVVGIDYKTFTVDLSCMPSNLEAGDDLWRNVQPIDQFWDREQEALDDRTQIKKSKQGSGRTRRIIQHPNFQNFNSGQAEQYLANRPKGDCVIRPSSRGDDHLALTWKVAEDVYQHLGE